MFTRHELRHLVIDIEFVLLSVVQGVALTTLAVEAAPALRTHEPLVYVFVISGLLFVLAFWSAALIHAISFVTWPMDLVHYYFYFALALLECLLFAQMERPRAWFAYGLAAYLVSVGLYVYDYVLMLGRRKELESSEAGRRLWAHMIARQKFEMFVFMPGGILLNAFACWLLPRNAEAALPLACAQLLATLLYVINLLRSFTRRQRLISELATG